METKKEIRKHIREKREALSEKEVQEKSQCIAGKIQGHEWFQEAEIIFAYVDFRKEVSVCSCIETAWKQGKMVGVPKVAGERMDYYQISSWTDLEESSYGILEPKEGCAYIQPDQEDQLLVIMPGVAFDPEGNRIGYGGGFYDRYFSEYPEIHKIAAAFEVQIVPHIETESHDLRPDLVMTEEHTYESKKLSVS